MIEPRRSLAARIHAWIQRRAVPSFDQRDMDEAAADFDLLLAKARKQSSYAWLRVWLREGRSLATTAIDERRRRPGGSLANNSVEREKTMEGIWQDLRHGARMLWKQPMFTIVAVLTLALGIGANTAIFSVINTLILSPPAIADPDRVVTIWRTPKGKIEQDVTSYLELNDWRSGAPGFESMAGYKRHEAVLLNDGRAERAEGLRVTANFLSLLKVQPYRGRDFQPDEERLGAAPVVVLGYDFWRNRFGGIDNVVGQQLPLDGRSFTIVGILPASFEFPLSARHVDLITTVAAERGNLDQRGAQILSVVGRLKSGVSLAQAEADIRTVAGRLELEYPQYDRDVTAHLVPVDRQIVGADLRRSLWVLLGTVAFILLIACTNVTNLLLARASVRQKEFALRAALGAGKWQIARQALVESLMLAFLAAGAGLLIALWGLQAIQYYGHSQIPRLDEARIDARVLLFTLAVSVLTALLFSLLPVFKTLNSSINDVLKADSKSAAGGRSVGRWRDSLVIAEVALGLVLLIGAGLMIGSFAKLTHVDPGFEAQNVLTGQISMTRSVYARHEEKVRYVNDMLERLRGLPGVTDAAFAAPMPFSGGNVGSDFRIEGKPLPEPGKEPVANNRSVTPQYFRALGIPLRKGRSFGAEDNRRDAGVAIINETLAKRYFAGEDPIGMRISHIGANQNSGDPEQWEIVGVVGDVHHTNLAKGATPEIYLPYQENSWDWGNFFVRSAQDPAALAKSFISEIQSADGTVLLTGVQPLTQAIADTTAQTRFYTFLFSLFGATGLILTLTGIYSVISYTVSQRMREVGIRIALGAEKTDVLKLIVGHGMFLAAAGAVIGAAAARMLTRLMADLLFGISPGDTPTFVLISLLLMAAALLACWIPARRATRADPTAALRSE